MEDKEAKAMIELMQNFPITLVSKGERTSEIISGHFADVEWMAHRGLPAKVTVPEIMEAAEEDFEDPEEVLLYIENLYLITFYESRKVAKEEKERLEKVTGERWSYYEADLAREGEFSGHTQIIEKVMEECIPMGERFALALESEKSFRIFVATEKGLVDAAWFPTPAKEGKD